MRLPLLLQVRDAVSNFKSAHKQLSAVAEEQEELQFQAALANLTQAIHDAAETRSTATENGKGSKQDPQEDRKVELAQKAVDAIKQARRQRQFDMVVAAYMATAAVSFFWGMLCTWRQLHMAWPANCWSCSRC